MALVALWAERPVELPAADGAAVDVAAAKGEPPDKHRARRPVKHNPAPRVAEANEPHCDIH